MSFDIEKLYTLLPAFCRIRDTEHGEPLKEFLSVIAEQIAIIEEDLAQLNDDMFIETCSEWVVPYIGDLVKARSIFIFPDAPFNQRALVANTMAYRRRKGTAAVLEQLARDVTGWNAGAVEYFQVLATTQYLNHPRPGNLSLVDLRDGDGLEQLNRPFDRITHRVDVRRIESRRGKYNIPNVGIFLWRIGSHPSTLAPAFALDERRFHFDPLGKDTPLYNRPETEDQISHLAEPINVPMPISRRMLKRDLAAYYGLDPRGVVKSILIQKDGELVIPAAASPPMEQLSDLIQVCDLSDLKDAGGTVIGWVNLPEDKIAIDPLLGRLAFPQNQPPPDTVRVTYRYGFSAMMGGGEYGRADTFDSALQPTVSVSKGPADASTIQDALDPLAGSGGVVEIQDNEYYLETPQIRTPGGMKIELRAADEQRPILVLDDELVISGGENAEVTLNGLFISGGFLRIPSQDPQNGENRLRKLCLKHCTLLPGPSPEINGVPAQPAASRLLVESLNTVVEIEQCIIGGLRAVDGAKVRIADSIVDAGSRTAVAFAGPDGSGAGAPLKVINSTIIGKVHTLVMELASNTIFFADLDDSDPWPGPVMTQRLQQGCVRFSYLPPGSQGPRRYNCQPKDEAQKGGIRPVFTSLRYGDTGYCQLNGHCPPEILQGADDEAEMGAFHHLYQPQRQANLRARLDEYLRFGLEAGIFYAS